MLQSLLSAYHRCALVVLLLDAVEVNDGWLADLVTQDLGLQLRLMLALLLNQRLLLYFFVFLDHRFLTQILLMKVVLRDFSADLV